MSGNSGSFVPDGNERLRDKASQDALEALVSQPEFKQIFGEKYEVDPRLNRAIDAVVKGRSPRLVLADYTDGTNERPAPTSDGTGWAW